MTEERPLGKQQQLLRVSASSKPVHVVAEGRPGVQVDGRAAVDQSGNRTTVAEVDGRLMIRVPFGTDVIVGTTSGRVDIDGAVGSVAVVTESGRVSIEHATSVDVRANSSRVEVGLCSGECRVRTVSGRVEVDSCGPADVATETGRITLSGVSGQAHAHCVRSRIEIRMEEGNEVVAETVSGRIDVSLPPGTHVLRSDSGNIEDSEVLADCCRVHARSVSGRVNILTRS